MQKIGRAQDVFFGKWPRLININFQSRFSAQWNTASTPHCWNNVSAGQLVVLTLLEDAMQCKRYQRKPERPRMTSSSEWRRTICTTEQDWRAEGMSETSKHNRMVINCRQLWKSTNEWHERQKARRQWCEFQHWEHRQPESLGSVQ